MHGPRIGPAGGLGFVLYYCTIITWRSWLVVVSNWCTGQCLICSTIRGSTTASQSTANIVSTRLITAKTTQIQHRHDSQVFIHQHRVRYLRTAGYASLDLLTRPAADCDRCGVGFWTPICVTDPQLQPRIATDLWSTPAIGP